MNLRDLSSRKGLTLIELLIFAAIFSGAAVIFVAILVSVTQVELRQTGAAEVQQQSQFVLQTVQNAISGASYITTDLPSAAPSSGIRLFMADKAKSPTLIYWDDGKIILKEGTAASSSLTSPAVRVTGATSTKFSNSPGHDSANFVFTMELNSSNPRRQFSQTLATGIARVGAATFDDNLNPGLGTPYALGNSAAKWTSINEVIYFGSDGRVGIGVNPPSNEKLEVAGKILLQPQTSAGTCNRGAISMIQGSIGNSSDTLQVCLLGKNGSAYWETIK